jgi:proteic killer suppression protein
LTRNASRDTLHQDPRRISHKGLKLLWVRGDARKLRPDWVSKIKRILAALNVASAPSELNLPRFHFHELKGDRKGTYALTVIGNQGVTFKWDPQGPYDVNLEDYHGH